jgi:Fe-S oxidoreductase
MSEYNEKDVVNTEKGKNPSDDFKEIFISANYCFNCNRCEYVCPVSQLGIFSPRGLITDLTFLSMDEVLENNNIWNCLTCGACMEYCPMTKDKVGVNIPELILKLRKHCFANNIDIEGMIQCETHDEVFSLIPKIMANSPIAPDKLGFLEDTGLTTKDSGEIAYFVGCIPLMEDMLYDYGINYIDSPKTIIGMLNENGITPVVLNEKCCGHDILWGKGDTETFEKLARYNVKLYKDAGVKTIIVGCAEGYKTWKFDYPKVIDDFDFEVVHFSEFFLKEKILENVRFSQETKIKVTYHDSCRIGRLGGKLYDAPRELLKQIPGVELVEMENIKDDAKCCGVSAFMGCNEFTRTMRQNRIIEAVETGANYLIVPCPKCLTHFTCYLQEPSLNEDKRELRNKIQVVDLASFIGKILYIV